MKSGKRKRNQLSKEVNRIDKILCKLILLIVNLPLIVKSLIVFIQGSLFDKENIQPVIITIIFTTFVFGRVLNKNRSKAMRALRGYCTYKEALKLLENEKFERIDTRGEKLMASEKWIYAGGTFIPKNFIAICNNGEGLRSVMAILVLLNGRVIGHVCENLNHYPRKTVSVFHKLIKHAREIQFRSNFDHDPSKEYREYRKAVKIKLDNKLEEGKTMEDIIKRWDSSFSYDTFLREYRKNKRSISR